MQPILLTLAVFAFWSVTGFAATALCGAVLTPADRLRLAPCVGMSLGTILTLSANRAGLPVGSFALPMVASLLVVAIATLAYRRAVPSLRDAAAIAVPLVAVLAVATMPMQRYGFDWMSYCNDDMTNYALSAQRFMHEGYFSLPPLGDAIAGRRLYEMFWGFYTLRGERAGAELNLAVLASIAHRNTFECFMPLIVAAYLAMLAAVPTLLGRSAPSRRISALAIAIVGFAPLTLLGMFYQLLGQIFGMALLVAFAGTFLRDFAPAGRRERLALAFVRAALVAGLIAVYPELATVAVVALVVYGAVEIARRRSVAGWPERVIALASGAVLLNSYTVAMVALILDRSNSIGRASKDTLAVFPYYLLPSGPATAWGLQAVAYYYAEPLESLSILAGFALSVALVAATFRLTLARVPATWIALIFFGLIAQGVSHDSGFALFKIAMYVQPFALVIALEAAVALARRLGIARSRWRLALAPVAIAAVAAVWVPTVDTYMRSSMNAAKSVASTYVEIPGSTRDGLLSNLDGLQAEVGGRQINSDTTIQPLAKAEIGFLNSVPMIFNQDWLLFTRQSAMAFGWNDRAYDRFLRPYLAARDRDSVNESFVFDPAVPSSRGGFVEDRRWTLGGDRRLMLVTSAADSVLNRSETATAKSGLALVPYTKLSHHLVLQDTTIGGAFSFVTKSDHTTFFALQPDFYFPESTMQGFGRYLLFSVEGRPSKVRMVLDLTTSLQHDGRNAIPHVVAVGEARVPFDAVGRGSARLLSPPLDPRTIGNLSLIGLDMGVDGSTYRDSRPGLLGLYGRDVPRDPRSIIGYFRNLSLVDADRTIDAPSSVGRFPEDLANSNLLYSGLYEDGYGSETFRVTLRAPSNSALHVRGLIPLIEESSFRPHVTASIDGRLAAAWDVNVGNFDLEVPGTFPAATYSVEIHFDRSQRLPEPDGRIIGCKIDRIGFEPVRAR